MVAYIFLKMRLSIKLQELSRYLWHILKMRSTYRAGGCEGNLLYKNMKTYICTLHVFVVSIMSGLATAV